MCEEQFIFSVDLFICVIILRKLRWVGQVWGRRHMYTGFFCWETWMKKTIHNT